MKLRLLLLGNSSIQINRMLEFSHKYDEENIDPVFSIIIFGEKIDYKNIEWHKDYKSGYVYPYKRFDKIKYNLMFNKGVDVIFTWELSRFYYGVNLALLYKKTKDVAYYRLFKSLVSDWLDKNRFLYGITWTCAMDVAIRAVNWIVTCNMFSEVFYNDVEFVKKISISLVRHGHYVETFAWTSPRNNHLISDYCSLLIIALSLRNYKKSNEWIRISMAKIEECVEMQIFSDGTDFENAVPYHRLVLEILSITTIIAHNLDIRFSNQYYAKLFGMFEFTAAYMDQSGHAPQIGDNDSGRFLIWHQLPENDHRYLLLLGASLFDYDFLKNYKQDDLFQLFPVKSKIKIEDLGIKPRITNRSIFFTNGGYYILKNDIYHLIVFCPNSRTGGHRHYDSGSFVLSVKGKEIIVDPGVEAYTRDLKQRCKYKDYYYHNLYVEEKYINANNGSYFGVNIDRNVNVRSYTNNEIIIETILPSGVNVVRRFMFQDEMLRIEDKIDTTFPLITSYHFPTSELYCKSMNEYVYADKVSVKIASQKSIFCECKEYDYSPSYGVVALSSCLIVNLNEFVDNVVTTFNVIENVG